MPGFDITINQQTCDDARELGWGPNELPPGYYGPTHKVEVGRKHRYKFETFPPFGDSTSGILLYGHKCGRPTIEVDVIKIHHGQDEIYRPGKQRWMPFDITFYEIYKGDSSEWFQTNETAQMIYDWWASTMIDTTIALHGNVRDYYKDAILQLLDGSGSLAYEYYLYDCWPSKITPSDLAYAESALSEITVTICYNKAKESGNNDLDVYGDKPKPSASSPPSTERPPPATTPPLLRPPAPSQGAILPSV